MVARTRPGARSRRHAHQHGAAAPEHARRVPHGARASTARSRADVVPHIGYMHRGGEKLMEAMDFRQGIGYCDRTEYLAQFSAELGYVMAVEGLMDIEVPERAEYIRVILTRAEPASEPLHVHGRVRHRRRRLRHELHVRLPRARVSSRTCSRRSPATG